jgi:glycine dehydrogenase subunit 2
MAVGSDSLHEFVATTRGSRVAGLKAVDVAKSLLDYGVYAPTAYFPTTIPEALMFEPTETESKRSLDFLADACAAIVAEAERDLEQVRSAPHHTPVSRVDEVEAARRPVLRWAPEP